jgi:hypothetical protein
VKIKWEGCGGIGDKGSCWTLTKNKWMMDAWWIEGQGGVCLGVTKTVFSMSENYSHSPSVHIFLNRKGSHW